MEKVYDRAQKLIQYPHVLFKNASSREHLSIALKKSETRSIMSYAIKQGSVVEIGPFFLNHMTVSYLMYLGIDVELHTDENTYMKFETLDDLIKIAVFKSQR